MMATTPTTPQPFEPFWRQAPQTPTPHDGEHCGELVFNAECGWWEYTADYVGDGMGFIAACARRSYLARVHPGLEFGIADRWEARGRQLLADLVIFTHGDPRPGASQV
jgi:hypothetical protein